MTQRTAKTTLMLGLILAMSLCRPALAMNQGDANTLALSLLQQSQRHCAVISVPHCGSGELAIGFWNRGGAGSDAKGGDSRLIIDAFEGDPALLATAQTKVAALGLIGRNMYVRSGLLSAKDYSMPYADNFCDLVAITNITDTDLNNISYAEVERVLCMGAKAWVGRATAEGKGMSAEALAKWIAGTHALSTTTVVSDATGTWAVITKISRLPDTYEGPTIQTYSGSWFYNDKKATWPCLPQWYAKPYGMKLEQTSGLSSGTRFSALSSGGGRLYGSLLDGGGKNPAYDRHGKYGSPPLSAFRAYNGQLLWTRSDVSGRILAYSKGVVCNDRIVDGETGDPSLDKTIPLPNGSVCWNAVDNDIYYAVVTDGGKNTLFAYNLTKNTTVYSIAGFDDNNAVSIDFKWNPTYSSKMDLFYRQMTIVMAGGKVYSYSGLSVYCYKLSDGSKIWGPVTAPAPTSFLRASASGVLLQTNSSGNEGGASFYFLSAADGSLKWGPTTFRVAFRPPEIGQSDSFNNGREFVIASEGDGTVLDLLTGKKLSQHVPYGGEKGGCGNGRMTPAGTYSQTNGMQYSFPMGANVVRGANPYVTPCNDEGGPFATSGMTIYPAKGCLCYGVFSGTKSEAPRGSFDSEQPAVESERLEKGPAYASLTAQVVPDALDWPTHRANNNRSASSTAHVATDQCVQLWKYTNPTPNVYTAPKPDDLIYTYQDITPPVTAGGYTYIAGSDGVLKCFQNSTGKNIWNYVTGGWIFATPTVANGCVYVGSGDGYAYCIEAHTGRLVWRFRAAPTERRFNYFGHLISTWPILTGVLVHTNGLAYFVSGIRDEYGVQAYAVDARTGSLTKGWQNTRVGVHWVDKPGLGRIGHIPGGYMTVLGSNLYVKEPSRPIQDMTRDNKDWVNGGQPQRMGVFDLKTGAMPSDDNMRMTPRYYPLEFGQAYRNVEASGRQIAVLGNYVMGWGEEMHSEMGFKHYGGDGSFIQIGDSGNPVQPFLRLAIPGKLYFTQKINCLAWDNANFYFDRAKYDMSTWKKWLDSSVLSGNDIPELPAQVGGQWKPTTAAVKGVKGRALALTANALVDVNSAGDISVMDRVTGSQLFKVSSEGEPYLHALAVDRNGRIIVANRNGDVVCFGATKTE